MKILKNDVENQVICIGAGPIGLFLAIQIRLQLNSDYFKVVMLEQNKMYKREQTLYLEPISFDLCSIENSGFNSQR